MQLRPAGSNRDLCTHVATRARGWLLGTEVVTGIQSNNVLATVKHFAVKTQEPHKDGNHTVDEQALHEIYFPPFESVVRDGDAGAVMCAYNGVNGDWSCENEQLLRDALRELWEFDGFVMSDWNANHSTAKAANAGLDVEMPGAADGSSYFGERLRAAIASTSPLTTSPAHAVEGSFALNL